ncbi:MAG: NAD/NADP octopine/nopaline dehydrogenase family protein [Anaerolineales bacterium]
MHVTICGGGNASHTLAALLSSHPDLMVRVYAPFEDEAARWRTNLASAPTPAGQGLMAARTRDGTLYGKPHEISAQAEGVIPGAELILLALPAFAHRQVLSDILPYLEPEVLIGALPARGGFDWECDQVFNGRGQGVTYFGLQTLPWACRIERFGTAVTILGTKWEVDVAVWPPGKAVQVAVTLSDLFHLQVKPVSNFLSLTLANPGQIIHPGIMYGLFHHWDGSPYKEAPLFYQNVDQHTARLLGYLSDEVQAICRELQSQLPELDLAAVIPLHEWLRRSYADDLGDDSSIQSCFRSNRSYADLRAPMRAVAGGLAPDYQARYLVEDVPFGLLATRGIAEIAGVETPIIDEVIGWAQYCMGKDYLQAGKLCGRDIAETRAPQRYGIKTIQQLIGGTI